VANAAAQQHSMGSELHEFNNVTCGHSVAGAGTVVGAAILAGACTIVC